MDLGIPEKYTDITIIVDNKKYKLHKIMLSKIPFFDKLFSSGFKEGSQKETVLDVDRKAFEKIIDNLYYGFFKKPEPIPDYDYATIDTMLYLGMDEDLDIQSVDLEKRLSEILHDYSENYNRRVFLANFPEILEDLILLNNYLGKKTTTDIPTEATQLFTDDLESYPLSFIHLSATEYAHHPQYWKIGDITKIYHQYYEDRGEKTNEEMLQNYLKYHTDGYELLMQNIG